MSARATKQKSVIREALDQAHRPLSPQEIYSEARQQVPTLSIATVYRVVRTLLSEKLIVPVAVPGESDRYETQLCAANHHHHFCCNDCHRLFDIPGCGLQVAAQLPRGFSLSRHEVMLYGSCRDCHA